tara:strand:- start:37 stop:576 length:540 start_codon:yes stop_codon:yes gene_type:complete
MNSKISHKIKHRDNAKDIFITPLELALKHIDFIKEFTDVSDVWYDPFKNNGSYYNQFPDENLKVWAEILDGRNFFTYEPQHKPSIIISNPPYSCVDDVLKRSVSFKPKIISYLIGIHAITTKRLETMENAGYSLVKIHLCKVWKWYGMSVFAVWKLNAKEGIIKYDRKLWGYNKKLNKH